MEIPPFEGIFRRFGVFQIPFHDGVTTHHDFALRAAIHWDLRHCFVQDGDVLHHWHRHTLPRFDPGTGIAFQI